MSNLEEYIAGTNPQDAEGYLRVDNITADLGLRTLRFAAVSNKTYSVLFRNVLNTSLWSKLTDVTARSTNRVVTVTDSNPDGSGRYYRLVTPQQP